MTNVFVTCHWYILIWKYTWEWNIFVYWIGIFLYSNFFSLRGVICTQFFFSFSWKVAIFPVQSAQQLLVTVCMIMLLVFWYWMNSSNEYPHRLISLLQIIPLMSYSDCIDCRLHNCCLLLYLLSWGCLFSVPLLWNYSFQAWSFRLYVP